MTRPPNYKPRTKDGGPAVWEPHAHSCSNGCGAWYHDPVDVWPEDGASKEEYERLQAAHDKAHHCPKCNSPEFWIDDMAIPTMCHNGILPEPQPFTGTLPTCAQDDEERKKRRAEMHRELAFPMLGGGKDA